jgi:hypothetical protein
MRRTWRQLSHRSVAKYATYGSAAWEQVWRTPNGHTLRRWCPDPLHPVGHDDSLSGRWALFSTLGEHLDTTNPIENGRQSPVPPFQWADAILSRRFAGR